MCYNRAVMNTRHSDIRTERYYSDNALILKEKYSGTEDLFSPLFLKHLPTGSRVLDIGCGSGRDLAYLKKSGFAVTGADNSKEMLQAAVEKYPELASVLYRSGLPELPQVNGPYDGMLCSALFQHIPDDLLRDSFRRIRELLSPGGIFLLSFPVRYPGIDPQTNRDTHGRLFYIRPKEIYSKLIEGFGLKLLEETTQADSLGREVLWTVQVWKRGNRAPE